VPLAGRPTDAHVVAGRTVVGRPADASAAASGDHLRVPWLHVDEHLVAVDKPAGLLAVPGRGAEKADCLSRRVQLQMPDALVVHRLDQATSGLMLFARGLEMQRRLSRAFERRAVHKCYLAVASGRLGRAAGDTGTIDLPLCADWPNRPLQKIDHDLGKPAVTHWQVLAHGDHPVAPSTKDGATTLPSTRLALRPITGRSHQLRVHLATLGHPLLGDKLYAPAQIQAAAPRLLLHAWQLELAHPASGEMIRLQAEAPF
jgi:tRNA pseudouridine32 synthase/23S rRNA pseudouridine746 synthase